MSRPYFESDRESNRPYWETVDNWRSEEFWQDLLPVAEWRLVLEKHRVRALEESSSRLPSSAGGGSSSVPTQDVRGLDRLSAPSTGAGGTGSVPSALPSEEN